MSACERGWTHPVVVAILEGQCQDLAQREAQVCHPPPPPPPPYLRFLPPICVAADAGIGVALPVSDWITCAGIEVGMGDGELGRESRREPGHVASLGAAGRRRRPCGVSHVLGSGVRSALRRALRRASE